MPGIDMMFEVGTTPDGRSNERGGNFGTSKRRSPSTYRIFMTCLYPLSCLIYKQLRYFSEAFHFQLVSVGIYP